MSNVVIATYSTHDAAESAVRTLADKGVDMRKLSIVGRDYHTEEAAVGYYNIGDRMKAWGAGGAFWGGIWGLLFGAAFFIIPGVGPVVLAGPLVAALVGALEGAVVVGGLTALGAGLFSLDIPKDSIIRYETSVKAGKFVLVFHGDAKDVENVKGILELHAGQDAVESY